MKSTNQKKLTEKVVLGYWDIRGLANAAQTLLEYVGITDYERVRISADGLLKGQSREEILADFRTAKDGLVLKNLPYLKIGNKSIAQSQAILWAICEYAGREDLLGRTG